MVIVNAQIIGDSVILAGDYVEVAVTLSVPNLDASNSVQSSEVCEAIAWGSAQVHCICAVNEALVHSPVEQKPLTSNNSTTSGTSFAPWRGEKGSVVLATKPKILFCDLQLMPGQTRSFVFRELLPGDAPPSFRGKLVKYMYKVTIGTQKHGSDIQLLRLPIRVIVLQGISPSLSSSDTEDLAPSNPFLHTPQRDSPRRTLQYIQGISSHKNVSQYNIGHPKGHVVTFTIYKSNYKLGEDIVATFDFSKASVQCVQYSATLQSEEEVSEDHRKNKGSRPVVVPYSKTHEMCLSFSHTNFLLTAPLSVTPTFSTNVVSLRWLIHFEFVLNVGSMTTSTSEGELDSSFSNVSSGREEEWKAPSKLNIETLVWDLPITILPSSPVHLSQSFADAPHL